MKCAMLQIIAIMCVTHNCDYVCHTCAKDFLDSNFSWAVIDKISNFHEIAPNFTCSQKLQFFKYSCNFLDQLLHPNKFYGRDMSGILFVIFASCEPLIWSPSMRHSLLCVMSGSAELVIQGRLWIHGRIVRSLRWYGCNLVTFGENCCCHNLNIKIVWYIKMFSLEWNFTRNLSKLSKFWPKKLKKLFKGSLAKKSDFLFCIVFVFVAKK